jgi:hypothetical protein
VVLSDPSSRFAPVWTTVDQGSGPHIRGKRARLERQHMGRESSRLRDYTEIQSSEDRDRDATHQFVDRFVKCETGPSVIYTCGLSVTSMLLKYLSGQRSIKGQSAAAQPTCRSTRAPGTRPIRNWRLSEMWSTVEDTRETYSRQIVTREHDVF